MDVLNKIAASQGCSRVEWTTDTSNPGARAFYTALGAKPQEQTDLSRSDRMPE